jgi:hypothetical protein
MRDYKLLIVNDTKTIRLTQSFNKRPSCTQSNGINRTMYYDTSKIKK